MTAELDRDGSRYVLQPWQQHKLIRELAAGERSSAELGRAYGITAAGVRMFKQRHLAEVEAIVAAAGDEFAALWIADKGQRLAAYQDDYELAAASAKSDHHEWIKARTQILHAVAEETGQLPPRTTVAVQSVTHVIVGVDTEDLR